MNIYKLNEYKCCIYVSKNRSEYGIVCNVYNARNCSSLHIKFEILKLCKKSIYHNASSFFNSLSLEYSSLLKLFEFKVELKKISFTHVDRQVTHWKF